MRQPLRRRASRRCELRGEALPGCPMNMIVDACPPLSLRPVNGALTISCAQMSFSNVASQDEQCNCSLDSFDLAILALLQSDVTTPQRVSAPSVQRRIRRMEAAGVVQASVAIVDPSRVGRPITVIVEVELESEQLALIDQAKASFVTAAEVQQCYYVTGEYDFILIVTVPNMTEYEALTRRLFFGNSNVKRFRSFVAMDRVKVGLAVPVVSSKATSGRTHSSQRRRAVSPPG